MKSEDPVQSGSLDSFGCGRVSSSVSFDKAAGRTLADDGPHLVLDFLKNASHEMGSGLSILVRAWTGGRARAELCARKCRQTA